jgi:hypothetical protein
LVRGKYQSKSEEELKLLNIESCIIQQKMIKLRFQVLKVDFLKQISKVKKDLGFGIITFGSMNPLKFILLSCHENAKRR